MARTLSMTSHRAFVALALLPFCLGARDLDNLRILRNEYPRVFYFRASEAACSPGRYPAYGDWERDFSGLMGIIGKCLEEECQGREPRNPEFFTRFKQRHPEQVVLLHFNGNSRDPRYDADTFFPGHWIYRQAVMITEDIPAEAGQSTIQVDDTRQFRVNSGRYRTHNDDIALFGIRDGRHDWDHCEHVQLLSINHEQGTITVRRGCYGSTPLAFRANASRAAAHQVEGPWGQNNNLLWYYNYTTHCPRDAEGKTCADRLVDDLARWFGPGGKLAAFDGLEFDVLFNVTHGDTDGDGVPDNGVVDGRNAYGIGVMEFGSKLRERLGPEVIIQADGALGPGGVRSQRNWTVFNGIESEGWPNLNDWEIRDWSGGLNRQRFWRDNAFSPAFSYINHKWVQAVPDMPGRHRQVDVPFSRHRLVFAAGQFTDAMICYSSTPKPPPSTGLTYWERTVAVPANATLSFHLGMGEKSPELSDGIWFSVQAAVVSDEGIAQPGTIFAANTKEHRWIPCNVSLAPFSGQRVRLRFIADCGPKEDATTDHGAWGQVQLLAEGAPTELVTPELPIVRMQIRGREEESLTGRTGAQFRFEPALNIGGDERPAYFVHPPYRRETGNGRYPIWDEFIRGAGGVVGWLGKPEGAAVRLALQAPNLLEDRATGQRLAQMISGAAVVNTTADGVTITPRDPDATAVTFSLRNIPTDGPDMCISLNMRGAPMNGCPREMARFTRVVASGGMVDLMKGDRQQEGMCLRGQDEAPIDPLTGARISRGPCTLAGETRQAFAVHPPWRTGHTGYVYWTRDVHVPPGMELQFAVGMGEKSPERSDGVWFRVLAAPIRDNGSLGEYRLIAEVATKAHKWLTRTSPLTAFAGTRIRLKFVADAGPDDNSTTDHAHWADVRITRTGVRDAELTRAVEIMTWTNTRPFTSDFYFHHIKTDRIDLDITVESAEPVTLRAVSAHARPDAIARVFEKGIVLANPGLRPFTFDLDALAPGRRYRRLRGTPLQDTTTNNGQPVGPRVTLAERDALFLMQQPGPQGR